MDSFVEEQLAAVIEEPYRKDQLYSQIRAIYQRAIKRKRVLVMTKLDAASFVIMRHYGITDALTTNHHFEQASFTRLPAPCA